MRSVRRDDGVVDGGDAVVVVVVVGVIEGGVDDDAVFVVVGVVEGGVDVNDAVVVVVVVGVVEGGVDDDAVFVVVGVIEGGVDVDDAVVVVVVAVGWRSGSSVDVRSEVAGAWHVGGDEVAGAIACREAVVAEGSAEPSEVIVVVGFGRQDEGVCAVRVSGVGVEPTYDPYAEGEGVVNPVFGIVVFSFARNRCTP